MAYLISYQNGGITGSTTFRSTCDGIDQGASGVFSTTTSYQLQTVNPPNASVVDGVLLIGGLDITPNPSGTFSVGFYENSVLVREVVVNVADIPAAGANSPMFFKFSSAITTDSAKTYEIGVKHSAATVFLDANDGGTVFTYFLRTTTAVSATTTTTPDILYIVDELTGAGTKNDIVVTMDSTASTLRYWYVHVGHGGVLEYPTTASTNSHLNLNYSMLVHSGMFTMGTASNPIPRSSTAKLQMAAATGINVADGGVFKTCGESRSSGKDSYYCLLNADENTGATTLDVDRDTGWLNGDEVVVAPTGSTISPARRTLSADATAAAMTITSGLSAAHSGTAPRQAEVVLLTRNVQIFGASTGSPTSFQAYTASEVRFQWTELYNIQTITLSGSGTGYFDYCSFRDGGSAGFISAAERVTNCVFYSSTGGYLCGGVPEITGSVFIQTSSQCVLTSSGYKFNDNRIASCASGSGVVANAAAGASLGEFNNNVIHHCAGSGITLDGYSFTVDGGAIWHNNVNNTTNAGIYIQVSSTSQLAKQIEVVVKNVNMLGNRFANIYYAHGGSLTVDNCSLSGSTVFSTPDGVALGIMHSATFKSCNFRSASGAYAAHTTSDISVLASCVADVNMENCFFGATTEIRNQTNLRLDSFLTSQKHDQSSTNSRTFRQYGTVSTDTSIFRTSSPSERLTPNDASNKLVSGSRKVNVLSGTSRTVSVWVRESVAGDGTDYNGARVRLICKRNDAAGITSDQVLATATVSSEGAWQQLSAATPTVSENAVLELYVDCSGTTGWINTDDWAVV